MGIAPRAPARIVRGMRTHTDASVAAARAAAPARSGPTTRPPVPGDPGSLAPAVLTQEVVAQLQSTAGNRATAAAIRSGAVVQRVISTGQAAALAERLYDAMEGLGTDEDAVYGALSGRTPEDLDAIREAYYFAYNHTLLEDVNDDFSGDELARVMRLLEGRPAPGATATAAERETSATARARDIAQQLVDAISGAGTEEDQIFNALEGRSADEIAEIRRQYFALTGHSLDRDLRDDLSGDELERALALVHSTASGSFRQDFSEWLTEDYHAGGTGIWEWEIADRKFLIHVGVKFEPDPGLTAPISRWQAQVRSIWNRFALTGNGGQAGGGLELPIEFDLQNQSSAERSVRVRQNANGKSYAHPDRAYSNLWYVNMPDTVAPHEFGHLVGLPDEYERTLEDYESVTGEDLPEPGAVTAADRQVATDLRNALYLPTVADRATTATTVLTTAGLISGGAAQQGSQAQRVMQAYNSAYEESDGENLLHALRHRTAPDSFFTLIAVFSFVSPSIMGSESDHTHPVEQRHVRFALEVAREEFPDVTWGLRLLR